jgi:hypothetical protein
VENIIAVVLVIVFLGGILLAAKKFLKAPKGPLPSYPAQPIALLRPQGKPGY